jgi:hypothetical protein
MAVAFGLFVSTPIYCSEASKTSNGDQSIEEFYRVTNCARGGLPMEVQFVIDGNPPRLYSAELTEKDIDSVIAKLDSGVASLLKEAGRITWSEHQGAVAGKYQGPALEAGLSEAIVTNASRIFGLSFCGDNDSVGSSVFADLATYFSRSYGYDGEKHPVWLDKLGPGARSHANGILMVAVALKLAGINYDLSNLLRSF